MSQITIMFVELIFFFSIIGGVSWPTLASTILRRSPAAMPPVGDFLDRQAAAQGHALGPGLGTAQQATCM